MELCALIGLNIRRERTVQKLSQEELAFRAGLDRSYLSEIENGHKNLSIGVMAQIATALDMKLTTLLKGYDA